MEQLLGSHNNLEYQTSTSGMSANVLWQHPAAKVLGIFVQFKICFFYFWKETLQVVSFFANVCALPEIYELYMSVVFTDFFPTRISNTLADQKETNTREWRILLKYA